MKNFHFVLLLLTSSICFADVSYEPSKRSGRLVIPQTITISGTIGKDDIAAFNGFIDIAKARTKTEGSNLGFVIVTLNSLGGDVASAMSIGNRIRELESHVTVLKRAKCASACVFLLAAGSGRYVEGKVGIHRPYKLSDVETTAAGQKAKFRELEKEVKAYLEAMNIPSGLYDRMLRIPPERIHWLSDQEMQSYGLNENDPYFDEAQTTRAAESFGMTKKEYRQFMAEFEIACANRVQSKVPVYGCP